MDESTEITEAPADLDLDAAAEVLADDAVDTTVAPEQGNTQPEDPYHAYGGKDVVERAHQMWQAAQTEDGVVRLWLEAGRSLGLGLREMEALVAGNPVQSQEAEVEDDPDRVLTYREFVEMQQRAQEQAAARTREQSVALARQTVSDTFGSLGVDQNDPAAGIILNLADKYLKGPDDLSPESVRAAIQRGHADFQVMVENQAKQYLKQKVATRQTLPKSPSGSAAPSAPPTEEPASLEEAFARVRKQLGLR